MSAIADFQTRKEINISLLSVLVGNIHQHFFNKSVCLISMLFEVNNEIFIIQLLTLFQFPVFYNNLIFFLTLGKMIPLFDNHIFID